MRPHGRADSDPSRGPRGHECCIHDGDGSYRRRLAEFFTEGLGDGLRVTYVSAEGVEAARAELAELVDGDQLVAEGVLHVVSPQDMYGPGAPVDPERVLAGYAAATEEALADGFRGLRVSGDVTELVRTPQQQDAFARYEFLLGHYMAGHPLTALCGYRLELGHGTVTEFASLHTAGSGDGTGFEVFSCPDGVIGLAGQFDPLGVVAVGRMLTRLRAGAAADALVVDLAGVEYVDHRLLLTLSAHARAEGRALFLRSAPPFAARLMDLLSADLKLELGAQA